MDYRAFGRTGVRVSELCFGTMSFGGDADEKESGKMYKACREAGINFFDCANVYQLGGAEKILGKLIRKERDELVITSKCAMPFAKDKNARGANRRHIMASVEASLKRLGTDRLDVYFMHKWDSRTDIEETLRALEQLVADGKVLYLGASNYSAWQIAKALGISDKRGWPRFDVIQPMYNLVKRQVEVEILPLALEENIAVMPYSPVGGGLLSGKYSPGKKPKKARLSTNKDYVVRYGEDWVYEVAGNFTEFAKEKGVHPVSLAVAWVSNHPAITCPIIGARSVKQLKPSLDSIKVDMTDDLYAEMAALTREPPLATDRREEAGWS